MMTLFKHSIARSVATLAVVTTCALGSFGCSGGELEPLERSTDALGSTEPVQEITTWAQLTQMTATGNYLLKANLNAAGKTWTPKDFRGTFDGGSNTISNLTVSLSSNVNTTEAGFFKVLTGAIVRNVKFTNLSVTARQYGGGVAGAAYDSKFEGVSVQGTVATSGAAGIAVGGIVGTGDNVQIKLCSVKGTVSSALRYAGGIAGALNSGAGRSEIAQSYSWATVTGDTSDPSRYVIAGGIVAWMWGGSVKDVYAVGNVTGRGRVGGLVGSLPCSDSSPFVLNHGIFRGDVIDKDRSAGGGWAGTFGTYEECASRFDQLIWDRTFDSSTTSGTHAPVPQKSATDQELMTPTGLSDAPFNYPDNKYDSSMWDAGSASQHHALKNMPGGLTVQPRCMVNGAPSAC